MAYAQAKVWLHRGTIYMNGVPDDRSGEFAGQLMEKVGNASFHGGHNRWCISLSREAVAGLRSMGLPLPPKFAAWEAEQNKLADRRRQANKLKRSSSRELKERLETAGVRFKRELFEHQLRGLAYAIRLPAAALLMDTGTGKTATMATVMQSFVDKLGYKRMLVIAPKTILNTGWGDDLDDFSWLSWVNISDPPRREEITVCPLCQKVFKRHVQWRHIKSHMTKAIAKMGEDKAKETLFERFPQIAPPAQEDRRSRLLRALDGDDQVFLINPEGFKLVLDDLMEQDWDMVVVDESSMLKSPKSAITQKMQLFGGRVNRRYIMTATPRPNSSLDFWGQMAFLDQCLGGNFYSFREKFFYMGHDGYSWHPREEEETDRKIWDIVSQRSYRVKLEDCVDLPGETTERIEVDLTGSLAKHYDDMLKKMAVMVDTGKTEDGKVIDTQWRIVQMNKLAQITSGYIFDNDGNVEFLGDSEKMKATLSMAKRVIEDEDRFVVIWARFSEEMRMLEDQLQKYGVSTCHGRTKNVDKSVADFKARRNRVMIAHARSAQFGHTWTHSDIAIFHSYDYSWEAFYQAKRRIYRIGQTRPVTYVVNVARLTVDEEILAKVFAKEEASEAVVDENVFTKLLALRQRKTRRRSRR